MARIRFSAEFAEAAIDVDAASMVVDAPTLGEALREAAGRLGVEDQVFHEAAGVGGLQEDVKVLLDGREVNARALVEEVAPGSEVVVAPLRGSARPLDNA